MKKFEISKILPLIMLGVLLIIGGSLSATFLTVGNLSNIIQYAVESAFIAIGMTFVLLIGGIDLSVGSILAFATVVAARLAIMKLNTGLILLVVIVIGALVGFANGLLITRAKIVPFMATLGTMMILRACTFLFTGGGPIIGTISASFRSIIKGELFGVQLGIYYVVIAFVIAFLVLNMTHFGRHVYAIGGNRETANLFGVRVIRIETIVYIISAILAAISGMLITARIGIGEPRSGYAYEMTGITMCVVGGVSMNGGKGSVLGTFIGMMVICMLKNLMNILNIDTNAQPVVTGIIILITTLVVTREDLGKRKQMLKSI